MMTPEIIAKEISQKIAADLEATLTAALIAAKKEWLAQSEQDLQKLRDWVRAAPIAVSVPFSPPVEQKVPPRVTGRNYASRGEVPKALYVLLTLKPGLKTAEIMRELPLLSQKSIANELSRGKAKNRYRREPDGGWFTIEE